FNGNGQLQQDVLSSVVNSRGGGATVGYMESASHTDNPGAGVSLLVANSIVTNDGRGTYATTTYGFKAGTFYLGSDVRDRRFAGFGSVGATSSDAAITTYYGQDSLAHLGLPVRKDIADPSGNLDQRLLYRWDTADTGNSTFVGLGRLITENFGVGGSHRDKA